MLPFIILGLLIKDVAMKRTKGERTMMRSGHPKGGVTSPQVLGLPPSSRLRAQSNGDFF